MPERASVPGRSGAPSGAQAGDGVVGVGAKLAQPAGKVGDGGVKFG
jgi:hypothetical protein